ncbi:hypothetical protein OBBRIDRAFT_802898 [Obba rivulosa]|uniref:DUF4246 domain-containing protein n=1 Tax=Obba rivulosa TaxID=1052685 RepID=A0A8E2AVY7_9APHY|nr:hypothetical protein OBBRIDRAFT_802898 [Obba rivulosa]
MLHNISRRQKPGFPSPFDYIQNEYVPLIEQRMRKFASEITEITEKPRWYEKVLDDAIEQDDELLKKLSWETKDSSDLDKGAHYWQKREATQQWPRDRVTDVQLNWVFDYLRWAACQRDSATGIETTGISKIYRSSELIPAELKSELINAVSVLDLVHPSMYCLRIGKSLVKDLDTGKAVVTTVQQYLERRSDLSKKFTTFTSLQHQWIPTDFCVSEDGDVRPLAYINNMHPKKHAALGSSPLWERVLTDALNPAPPLAIQLDALDWYDPIEVPEPDYRANYGEDKRGEYRIYYYESSNITESRLAFRAAVGDGSGDIFALPYERGDVRGWKIVYGVDGNGGSSNQPLRSVITKEDLSLAFPNIYQHRVAPCKLADPTEPGVRKILCFFLVDPMERILSTTEVPPQQRSWHEEEMTQIPRLQDIATELYEIIRDEAVDGTITLDEAKEERLKLMEERANFVVDHSKWIFEVPFNMLFRGESGGLNTTNAFSMKSNGEGNTISLSSMRCKESVFNMLEAFGATA